MFLTRSALHLQEIEEKWFQASYEMLTDSLNQGILALADVQSLHDKSEHIKKCVDDTPASYFVEFHAQNSTEALSMLMGRLWDRTRDTHSLLNTANETKKHAGALLKRHVAKFGKIFPNFEDSCHVLCEKRLSTFLERVESISTCEHYDFLKLHRDEKLAHLLSGSSRFRRKLEREGRQEVFDLDPSLLEIIKMSEATLQLILDFRYIWKWEISDFRSKIELYRDVFGAFWQSLDRCQTEVVRHRISGKLLPRDLDKDAGS